MKTIAYAPMAALVILAFGSLSEVAGATSLTGINVFRSDSGGNSPLTGYSNTVGADNFSFNLYGLNGLPPSGLSTANPFLNSGNFTTAPTRISVDLSNPGTYSYTFLADASRGDVGSFAGMNFFFNSNDITPGISVFESVNATGVNFFPSFFADSAASTATLDPLINGGVQGSGTLSFNDGSTLVTLSEFRLSSEAIFNVDRVSGFDVGSNTVNDAVAEFTLTVAAVPEPSSFAFLGLSGIVLLRRRHGSGKRPSSDRWGIAQRF